MPKAGTITACRICGDQINIGHKPVATAKCNWCKNSTPDIDLYLLGLLTTKPHTTCQKCHGMIERTHWRRTQCESCSRQERVQHSKRKRPNWTCSVCQKPIYITKTNRPNPICRPCRQELSDDERRMFGIRPRHRPKAIEKTCEECGSRWMASSNQSRYCSHKCSGKAQSRHRRALRHAVTAKSLRVDLAAETLGLNTSERTRLRNKWIKQKRTCIYCHRLATTIEHVVPLVRGGTNYEGNLAPACSTCNSRKKDRLLIEYKLGRKADYINPKRGRSGRPWRRLRAELLAADDTCWICGHEGSRSIDHLIPLSKGGHPTSLDNLRPAHGVEGCPDCGRKCNMARGNRDVDAA